MPKSRVRKEAVAKRRQKRAAENRQARYDREARSRLDQDRSWVPWVFMPLGILGVLWMVVWNVAGYRIGFMAAMGGWNVFISLCLIMSAFAVATLWK